MQEPALASQPETNIPWDLLFNSSPDWIWVVESENFGLTLFNQRFSAYFWQARQIQLCQGQRPEDLFASPEEIHAWQNLYRQALQTGHCTTVYTSEQQHWQLQLQVLQQDQQIYGISVFGRMLDLTSEQPSDHSLTTDWQIFSEMPPGADFTTQKQTETRLKNLNRSYAVLSAVNAALIRIREPQTLFAEVCRIAVNTGDFRMAWIGQRSPDGSSVAPLCHAGFSQGYVEQLRLLLARQQGPVSQTLLKGNYWVCNDITQTPPQTPWRDLALERGYRATAAFPILVSGEVAAAINLYADTPDFFDPQQIELLLQLSADLGFALEFFATEVLSRQELETRVAERTQALEISERRLRRLVEGVKQDYFFFTVGKNREFTYLSPSASDFFEQKLDDMLGKTWYEALHFKAEDLRHVEKVTGELAQGQDPPPFEVSIETQGQQRFFEITEHLTRDAAGKVVGGEGVARNITRQKQIEAELREAKDKAEHSSQAKSQFLSHMSHELRTPLNVILGFSELMQEQLRDPRWQSYVQAINSSGRNLLNIINNILDLSKIEAGKIELYPEPVSLNVLIKELELMFRHSFEHKGLAFNIQLSAELPESLWLDPLRLRQVLLNLLSNALKFTSAGQVTLSAAYRALNAESGELQLVISDTGPGISAEFQHKIFEPFSQDASSGQSSAGTGLGLPITRSLVELMHGQILLKSQPGTGTHFTVLLPEVKRAEAASSPAHISGIAPGGLLFAPARLLLADDLPQNLQLLQAFLADQPFECLLAHNGQEACEMARQQHPDLILMDIRMPVMGGREALQQLKADPDTQAIPIVALTAFSLQQDETSLRHQGFDAYLRKPVSKANLLACLTGFLSLQSPASAAQAPSAALPQLPAGQKSSQESGQQQALPLQELLQNEWLPRWENIRHSLILDELESFAQELQSVADAYAQADLQQFVRTLLQHLQDFSLEAGLQQLEGFPELLSKFGQEKRCL